MTEPFGKTPTVTIDQVDTSQWPGWDELAQKALVDLYTAISLYVEKQPDFDEHISPLRIWQMYQDFSYVVPITAFREVCVKLHQSAVAACEWLVYYVTTTETEMENSRQLKTDITSMIEEVDKGLDCIGTASVADLREWLTRIVEIEGRVRHALVHFTHYPELYSYVMKSCEDLSEGIRVLISAMENGEPSEGDIKNAREVASEHLGDLLGTEHGGLLWVQLEILRGHVSPLDVSLRSCRDQLEQCGLIVRTMSGLLERFDSLGALTEDSDIDIDIDIDLDESEKVDLGRIDEDLGEVEAMLRDFRPSTATTAPAGQSKTKVNVRMLELPLPKITILALDSGVLQQVGLDEVVRRHQKIDEQCVVAAKSVEFLCSEPATQEQLVVACVQLLELGTMSLTSAYGLRAELGNAGKTIDLVRSRLHEFRSAAGNALHDVNEIDGKLEDLASLGLPGDEKLAALLGLVDRLVGHLNEALVAISDATVGSVVDVEGSLVLLQEGIDYFSGIRGRHAKTAAQAHNDVEFRQSMNNLILEIREGLASGPVLKVSARPDGYLERIKDIAFDIKKVTNYLNSTIVIVYEICRRLSGALS